MKEQRTRARASWKGGAGKGAANPAFAKLAETGQKTTANARELIDSLPRAVTARVEVLKGEVERTLLASQQRVALQCEEFEQKAMVFEEWMETQTAVLQKTFESETCKAICAIKREWQEKAAKRLLEEEYRIGTLISCLDMIFRFLEDQNCKTG